MIQDDPSPDSFSDEAALLISLIGQHAPLHRIESTLCPKCEAPFRVGYYSDGKGFVLTCRGTPPHSTQYQELTNPPPWWKDRIIDISSCMDC